MSRQLYRSHHQILELPAWGIDQGRAVRPHPDRRLRRLPVLERGARGADPALADRGGEPRGQSVDPARVDLANDGKLVHVSGDLKAGAPLADPDFAVSATALRLVRVVEMYQWKEESETETRKNFGGSEETVTTYEYRRGLVGESASIPAASSGRRATSIRRCATAARPIRRATRPLGAFRPGTNVIEMLPANDAAAARSVAGAKAPRPRQGTCARRRWPHLSRRESVRSARRRPAGQLTALRRTARSASSAARRARISPSTRPRPATATLDGAATGRSRRRHVCRGAA